MTTMKKACEPSTVAASSSVPYQPSITTSVVAIAIWAIWVPTSGSPSASVAQIWAPQLCPSRADIDCSLIKCSRPQKPLMRP